MRRPGPSNWPASGCLAASEKRVGPRNQFERFAVTADYGLAGAPYGGDQ